MHLQESESSGCDCPPDACLCGFAEGFNASQARLRAERDRYKEALEKIARLDGRNYPHAEPVIQFAREALDG